MDKLEPSDVEALIPALHSVGRYDKELFQQMADIVKVRKGVCGLCVGLGGRGMLGWQVGKSEGGQSMKRIQ